MLHLSYIFARIFKSLKDFSAINLNYQISSTSAFAKNMQNTEVTFA